MTSSGAGALRPVAPDGGRLDACDDPARALPGPATRLTR